MSSIVGYKKKLLLLSKIYSLRQIKTFPFIFVGCISSDFLVLLSGKINQKIMIPYGLLDVALETRMRARVMLYVG